MAKCGGNRASNRFARGAPPDPQLAAVPSPQVGAKQSQPTTPLCSCAHTHRDTPAFKLAAALLSHAPPARLSPAAAPHVAAPSSTPEATAAALGLTNAAVGPRQAHTRTAHEGTDCSNGVYQALRPGVREAAVVLVCTATTDRTPQAQSLQHKVHREWSRSHQSRLWHML